MTELVWADTIAIGRCRASECRERIFFAERIPSGARTPYTGEPVPLRTTSDPDTGRLIYHLDAEANHFRSCVAANTFSASARRKA